jgi:hypothetical protein
MADGSTDDQPGLATRLDGTGTPLVPSFQYVPTWPRASFIAWSGRSLYAIWNEASDQPVQGSYLRRLGAWGRPDTKATAVNPGVAPGHYGLAWTGRSVAVPFAEVGTSTPQTHTMFMYDQDLVEDAAPNQFSDTSAASSSMTFSGSGFGWVYARQSNITGRQELHFQRLAHDGTVLVPEKLITSHQTFPSQAAADSPRIVSRGPGQGFGVAWLDTRAYPWQIWFEVVDDQGNVLPPGEVQVSNAVIASVPRQFALAWSGAEFLLIWTNSDQSQIGLGKLIATRISAGGAVLERRQITNGPADNAPDAAWDGHGYGVVFNHYLPAQNRNDVEFLRIGCSCTTDADGDGRLPCSGGDCDDSNPNVAAGRAEQCSDGLDNDCDGSADCLDSECSQTGTPPGEVLGVQLAANKVTISWPQVTGADSYDVLRGVVTDLLTLGNVSWALCQSLRQPGTSWTDASTPFAADGYYYLVRARGSGCVHGTWGSSARDNAARECP